MPASLTAGFLFLMLKAAANDLSPFGRYAPRGPMAGLLRLTRACPPTWAGRRSAYVLRDVATKLLHGQPLDVDAFGARMRLYPYNNVCEKRILFTPQYFDAPERDLLARHIRPDFMFIDVGSNIGGYALFAAASAGPAARILAIEPQREIFDRLIYNIRQNPFGTVKALDCALADRDGEITLFLDGRNKGETSMRIVHGEGRGERVTVPSKTLKSIVEEERFVRLDALKLDTEGAADVILEPFFRDVPQSLWPRLLITETFEDRPTVDMRPVLAECGYREVLSNRSNMAFERKA